MRDRALEAAQAARARIERATGRALGDQDMPAREHVEEMRHQLRSIGDRVLKTTGKALGDEDMTPRAQVEELKDRWAAARAKAHDTRSKDARRHR